MTPLLPEIATRNDIDQMEQKMEIAVLRHREEGRHRRFGWVLAIGSLLIRFLRWFGTSHLKPGQPFRVDAWPG